MYNHLVQTQRARRLEEMLARQRKMRWTEPVFKPDIDWDLVDIKIELRGDESFQQLQNVQEEELKSPLQALKKISCGSSHSGSSKKGEETDEETKEVLSKKDLLMMSLSEHGFSDIKELAKARRKCMKYIEDDHSDESEGREADHIQKLEQYTELLRTARKLGIFADSDSENSSDEQKEDDHDDSEVKKEYHQKKKLLEELLESKELRRGSQAEQKIETLKQALQNLMDAGRTDQDPPVIRLKEQIAEFEDILRAYHEVQNLVDLLKQRGEYTSEEGEEEKSSDEEGSGDDDGSGGDSDSDEEEEEPNGNEEEESDGYGDEDQDDEEEEGGDDAQEESDGSSAQSGGETIACPACTYANRRSREECSMCGTALPQEE